MSTRSDPPSSPVPAATRTPRAIALGTTVELGPERLELVDIVSEEIAEAPDARDAYPAGSGVTVTVVIGGERSAMTLLSKGYTSTPVTWVQKYRLELVRVDGQVAHLHVDRVTDHVVGTQAVRIRRGETVRVHERVDFAFREHGHKRVEPGIESPLLVRVAYDGAEQSYALFPPNRSSFMWRDLQFTLGAYEYNEYMDLSVDRLELEAVPPATRAQ